MRLTHQLSSCIAWCGQSVRHITLAATLLVLMSRPAGAEGFFTPFLGYNFGGDSGNCQTLTNCQDKHKNFGVSLGATGPVFGFEEDISYAKNFFGDAPGTDNSVFSAMSNLLVGVGVGPVRPYLVAGLGLVRPHVSTIVINSRRNTLGYDIGGGLSLYASRHVGLRGDVRRFHTFEDAAILPVFTGERLAFWRASVGLALKF